MTAATFPVDTGLIQQAHQGDAAAAESVFATCYRQLKTMARARLRATQRNLGLDSTSLVHEFYLRFAEAKHLDIHDRFHFLRYASRAMRCVIVDLVRQKLTAKRGEGHEQVTLDSRIGGVSGENEILRVHEALAELAEADDRLAQIVEMRYFAGLTEREIAEALGITDRTVRREWEKARLLLAEALR